MAGSLFDAILQQADRVVVSTFGEPITFLPGGGAPQTVSVIWTEPPDLQQAQIAATAWAPLSSFNPQPQRDDTIIRNGKLYRIVMEKLGDCLEPGTNNILIPLRNL